MGYTAHWTRSFVSLSLSLSLPLPLDEPVLMDAKEDKELAPSDMSARLSIYSPDAGSVLLSFLRLPVSLRGLRTFCDVRLLRRGVAPHDSATMSYRYPSSTTSSAPIKCMQIMGQLNLLRRALTMTFMVEIAATELQHCLNNVVELCR